MLGGGANHVTGEGICLEGEPITLWHTRPDGGGGRTHHAIALHHRQSRHRGGNMLEGGANHLLSM
eukprot:916452-Pyramimonas_sp.AAC.1